MPSWFRSLHFRLGALYAGVFGASVLVLGVFLSFATHNFLLSQLSAHVESSTNELMGDYRQDGIEELRHDIEERMESADPGRLWYFLQHPDGRIEFDPLPALPEAGWHRTEVHGQKIWLLVIDLAAGYRFAVGISMDRLHAAESALRRAFLLAILGALALGALGGFLVSRGFLRRLRSIQDTAQSFGEGNLARRLPAPSDGDEFDQLSVSLNSMFARIEELVSEVQRVTSNIAHDLRTPLGRMKHKLERIREDGELSPALRDSVEEISAELDGTLHTFTALLRISEVELGTRRAEFGELSLGALTERVCSAYGAVAEESGRRFQSRAPAQLTVCGDEALLAQLLANLIENAIQHTPAGTEIEVEARLGAHGGAELVVADRGPGIREEDREKVLKPFFKLDRSRGLHHGSGLGLSLVAAIARLHDAGLALEDNAPGTRVRIAFPPHQASR